MKRPCLVQRCEIGDGKIGYDYMGSTEFEIGDQPKSLKRIFAVGIAWKALAIKVNGTDVIVHMVAAQGFDFEAYGIHLQALANNQMRTHESTYFDTAVKRHAGLLNHHHFASINGWFDFENDVLWVLDKNKRKALIHALEDIKRKWSE